ncbi:MAG: hypothetical protein R3189_06990 [Thiomicrorhabdus chilensis]|uniref:hypothetical protein n=1 Tax=Thiomicrorhabdus chilensis TaxID=63656 RepID=UPI00299E7AFD|nr:hypothetical protein [Thiomicrorhabdus chilensis]MDX1347977.1 hypothetical protein [Thiomicrorhabdus chilensis]
MIQKRRALLKPSLHWLVFSLMTLFVFSQTAGLLHAEIHPFHQHTAECDIYEHMAQPSSGALDEVATLPARWQSVLQPAIVFSTVSIDFMPAFMGRAPPQA